ncbi:MAG TPA: hydrogenase expression/formation protein HypE [Verrucomicrobiae bacterium]|nr:hydrogenase expression/formation protein HypE [Verrucomicrobiae bacterium]
MDENGNGASLLSATCPAPFSGHREIVLGHGSGGKMSHRLIQNLVLPAFRNPWLESMHDGAILSVNGSRLAFTTDSYVVNPLFFPGGDIGKLAVHGTVNDLAMCGAKPLHLSAAFIIEEGLTIENFKRILQSMREAADAAGVSLVTGDTKVVDRGKGDQIFINTSGIGSVPDGITMDPASVSPGDKVLVSGHIAAHGIAIMSVREGLEFETEILSDTAPLNGLVEAILSSRATPRVLRDPTRGGVASALNEIAEASRIGFDLDESAIPIREDIKSACEMLGFDPLYVANEGKLIAIVPGDEADTVLDAMRRHPLGANAAIIGEASGASPGVVTMKTRVGGTRVVDMLPGEQLPRIC